MPTLATLNGATLASLGLTYLEHIDGLDDGPKSTAPTVSVPGAEGEIRTSDLRAYQARDVVVRGVVAAASTAALKTTLNALKYAFMADPARLTVDARDTTVRLNGVCVGFDVESLERQLSPGALKVRIGATLRCADPFYEEAALTTTSFTSSDTAMPVGTERVRPVITVTASGGACTNPTITLKNYAGTTIGTITFTGLTLPSNGDVLAINCFTGQITKTVSAVTTNAAATRTDASNFPVWLDPRDGSYALSQWPTLRGTVASGSATFAAAYRKRYA